MKCINKNCENEAPSDYYTCPPHTPGKTPFSPQEKFVFIVAPFIMSIFVYLIYKLHTHPFFWPVILVSIPVTLCMAMIAGHNALEV